MHYLLLRRGGAFTTAGSSGNLSVDALRRGHMMHLVIQWLVNHRSVLEHHLALLDLRVVNPGKRVLHPLLVIPLWEVFL